VRRVYKNKTKLYLPTRNPVSYSAILIFPATMFLISETAARGQNVESISEAGAVKKTEEET